MSLALYLNAKPVGLPALGPGQQSGAVRRVTFLTPEDTLFAPPKAMKRKTPPAHYQKRLGFECRQTILQYIADRGESTSREIAEALDMNLTTTRRHLRVLHDDGDIVIALDEPGRRAYVIASDMRQGS